MFCFLKVPYNEKNWFHLSHLLVYFFLSPWLQCELGSCLSQVPLWSQCLELCLEHSRCSVSSCWVFVKWVCWTISFCRQGSWDLWKWTVSRSSYWDLNQGFCDPGRASFSSFQISVSFLSCFLGGGTGGQLEKNLFLCGLFTGHAFLI